jgi:hypothetical protein
MAQIMPAVMFLLCGTEVPSPPIPREHHPMVQLKQHWKPIVFFVLLVIMSLF